MIPADHEISNRNQIMGCESKINHKIETLHQKV